MGKSLEHYDSSHGLVNVFLAIVSTLFYRLSMGQTECSGKQINSFSVHVTFVSDLLPFESARENSVCLRSVER